MSKEPMASEDASTLLKENVQEDGVEGPNATNGGETDTKRPPKRPRTACDQREPTAMSSPAPGNPGGGGDESTTTASTTTTTNRTLSRRFREMDPTRLRELACGSCVFCRMPRCGRCFECLSDARRRPGEGRGHCLRKMCIALPIELKLRDACGLGFPEGWRFAFDDPQKASLVAGAGRRILPLAGLRIVSPDGATHHSLECALAAAFPHGASSVAAAAEAFLVHVGSSRRVPSPHFLLDKNYCAEFVSGESNAVLFGTVVACMAPPGGEGAAAGEGPFFAVRYDRDALAVAERAGGAAIRPIQLVGPEQAWGGCVSYERKTCCRRDSRSAVRNIDQATAAETWVAPDVRSEDMEEGPDGTSLPRLTIFARGYKFVFRVRIRGCGDKRQFGVFATCAPLRGEAANQEINLKPGELIDLGTFAPVDDDDPGGEEGGGKPLSAFIVKNYIHKFRVGRWGVVSGRDDVVHDLTDDRTGRLRDAAARRVHSHVRGCAPGERPAAHLRAGPDARVHLLFGIPYEGNWAEYEAGMRGLVPLFGGREVEVAVARRRVRGQGRAAGAGHLRAVGAFQARDVGACVRLLERTLDAPGGGTAERLPPALVGRSKRVVECLEERTRGLLEVFAKVESQRDGGGGTGGSVDDSPLISALGRLKKLARLLEEHGG